MFYQVSPQHPDCHNPQLGVSGKLYQGEDLYVERHRGIFHSLSREERHPGVFPEVQTSDDQSDVSV